MKFLYTIIFLSTGILFGFIYGELDSIIYVKCNVIRVINTDHGLTPKLQEYNICRVYFRNIEKIGLIFAGKEIHDASYDPYKPLYSINSAWESYKGFMNDYKTPSYVLILVIVFAVFFYYHYILF